ncbi:hypothetical protein ADK75_11320 [Streptomyces virginiae]|uniref:Lipase n=1 Tax=Streptomyces virginiae TaxID=1961 RepID=A0A0L8MXZ7_STRVG|nr:hypothetical protein ADK75_11320 [Streptomyces virginiae]
MRRLAYGAVAAVALAAVPSPALASPLDDPSTDSFYTQSSPLLPALPHGTLLRSRPFTPLASPGTPLNARGWQIVYTSTDAHGRPIAVSGTVLVSNAAHTGPRPLIAWAAGTQGINDNCAPSHQYATGTEYEATYVQNVLARGWALTMTDYQGLGTPGDHTYLVGAAEGNAVLDSVRAARQLSGAGIGLATPVGITGYSQGGQAGGFAAEQQKKYAPEIRLKGVAVGGVAVDTLAMLNNVDGGLYSFLTPYALTGLNAAYPSLKLDSLLTPTGQTAVADARSKCLFDMFPAHAFEQSSSFTTGTPILQRPAVQALFNKSKVGLGVPAVPALIYHGVNDDVIPFTQAQQLHTSWCAKGGSVELKANATDHLTGLLIAPAMDWMAARFSGSPAPSGCP